MPTLGLFGANMGQCASAAGASEIGALAEQLGFDSLWMGEHVVAPSPHAAPSPIAPDYPILDPLVALAVIAGQTRQILLATGIVILPQRNPVVLAKQLASLDVLSGGRLVFGMGVGYLEPEMRAVGVAMEGRGARATEYLQAMRSLWTEPSPEFHGQHVEFAGVDAYPRPVHTIPVVMGGHSAVAHRRAVAHADGWYGFMLDRHGTAAQIDSLQREAKAAGRELEEFTISVSPSETLDVEAVQHYADLGVDRLVLLPPRGFWRGDFPLANLEAFVRANAPERVGAERSIS
jgi:probable F420-dependent oxidoreductase